MRSVLQDKIVFKQLLARIIVHSLIKLKLRLIFLWMGERESISPVLMFFAGKKHFIVWSYLSRTKLQILSPHAVLKLELRFKKFLVGLLRVHNPMGHFFKIRLSWGVI